MKRFVLQANLPENTETVIICSKNVDLLGKKLEQIGVSVLYVPDNPLVDARLAGHADLSVMHGGGERIFLSPYLRGSAFAGELERLGCDIRFPPLRQSGEYPDDAQMNIAVAGSVFFHTPGVSEQSIVDYLTNDGELRSIAVRQGYSRCSVCVVDAASIITADRGIAGTAAAGGMTVLEICPGYIDLPGFDCGFIGGASFKLSGGTLAFTGRLDRHPDRLRILDFLESRSVKPVFLTDEPAFDIGTAIPLTEKASP